MNLSLLLTTEFTQLSKEIIAVLQNYLTSLHYTPLIHFELEGCYQINEQVKNQTINFSLINQSLKQLKIDGEVIPEYWQKQWEYVSLFNGQLPLKEAENLALALYHIPKLFAQQGIEKTLIKPVVWAGDKGKVALGCDNVFSGETRDVHIPNAIQMNVSVKNSRGENIVAERYFGEYLQQCFLKTSLGCCLLYLPEEEAFERFALKTKYGLSAELCSPTDISGGHQGSIALYKELGKHNQAMGEQPLLYDQHNKVLVSESFWQKTARIEHRLGASSMYYNPYLNVIYGLLNVIDAIEAFVDHQCQDNLNDRKMPQSLPLSLYSHEKSEGAIELFEKDNWFAKSINRIDEKMQQHPVYSLKAHQANNAVNMTFLKKDEKLGDKLKSMILSAYQIQSLIIK
ncbi:hypothetical protein [Thalassotalea castellviae]|uniref:ATP-grasp domain-containing protein n=1 Tax=Thalassotalea castellviae TaxID=3075612 RepID=A0ABU2ZYT0_9GAMM|nr:hypothetical protein [Thalassotalea sp. W431]MDT0603049.1 hypothetical protein [Thalassotalea sp. W431]